MTLLKGLFLMFLGLSAGGIIAAGVFAFLAIIGVFPRLIGKTRTNRHIFLYETVIIIGGVLGNVSDLYEFPLLMGGNMVLWIYGLAVGIFVGCLVMSLAETLKALPVISRRLRIRRLTASQQQVSESSPRNRTYTSRCIRLPTIHSLHYLWILL